MSLTDSFMLDLGSDAPDFSLPDVTTGDFVSKSSFEGKPLLVMFICAHCPFVKHVEKELARIGKDYKDDVAIVGISSNDIVGYPEDSPDKLRHQAEVLGFDFPYLFDDIQFVAKEYKAACTPDIYLFDADHKLFYRGRLDQSRPGNDIPVDGVDLRNAIDELLAGNEPPEPQFPSAGCNIKWKVGNEPDYFA